MEVLQAPVTARRVGPSKIDETFPRVFYVTPDDLKRLVPNRGSKGGCAIFLKVSAKDRKVELYESVDEVRTALGATNTSISADPYIGHLVNMGVTGVSGGITTPTILTTYLNRYVSATGASAHVRLPAPSDRNAVVIVNTLSTPVSVYPNGASAFIDTGASGAPKVLPAYKRMHIVTLPTTGNGASAVWKSAVDKQMNAQ